jgi:hypothetical protein
MKLLVNNKISDFSTQEKEQLEMPSMISVYLLKVLTLFPLTSS